jgi:hypothetical protein
MDIPAIFVTRGESGFRQLESELLREVTESGRMVVALGGGALLSAENRAFCESTGRVVCLEAHGEELERRLWAEAAGRPLLGAGPDWQIRLRIRRRRLGLVARTLLRAGGLARSGGANSPAGFFVGHESCRSKHSVASPKCLEDGAVRTSARGDAARFIHKFGWTATGTWQRVRWF